LGLIASFVSLNIEMWEVKLQESRLELVKHWLLASGLVVAIFTPWFANTFRVHPQIALIQEYGGQLSCYTAAARTRGEVPCAYQMNQIR